MKRYFFFSGIVDSSRPLRYNIGWVGYYRGHFELAHSSWQEALDRAPEKPAYHAVV